MSGFRKKSFPIYIAPATPLVEIQSQSFEENVNGDIVTRVAKIPVDVCDPALAASIPTYKEYYLDNLLKAGVPLDQINVSSYFNPVDSVNIEKARVAALNEINSKISVE